MSATLPRRRASTLLIVLALAVGAAACREIPQSALGDPRAETADDRPDLKVAIVGALSGSNAGPAGRTVEGARLALDTANADGDLPVDLIAVSMDTEEDPTVTADLVAEDIVADPEVVAVIGWPSEAESAVMGDLLDQAGIVYLDVSPAGSDLAERGWKQWRRLVPTDREQVSVLVRGIAGKGPTCVVGDGNARALALQQEIAKQLRRAGRSAELLDPVEPEQDAYPGLVAQADERDCARLVWLGNGTDAATARLDLDRAGSEAVLLLGVDTLKNQAYLELTGEAGNGTDAVCPCIDLSEGESLPVRSFIQAYQARYGGTPGAYSAEGWDAGQMMVDAAAAGARTRPEFVDALLSIGDFEGIDARYRFDRSGERDGGAVNGYRATDGRWLPRANDGGAVAAAGDNGA